MQQHDWRSLALFDIGHVAVEHRDAVAAGETFAQHLLGTDGDHVLELTHTDRDRIFNLGYYTWVEQQGVALEDFDARRDQGFWKELRGLIPEWDRMIEDFNHLTGVNLPG